MLAQMQPVDRVRTEAERPAANSHRVEYDVVTDVIRVTAAGFWSPEELRANMGRTERVLNRVRGSGRQVRVLVDLSAAHLRSRDTADEEGANATRMYRPDERVAIVVAGGIATLQARRVKPDRSNHRLFASVEEAEAWLLG